MSDQVFEKRPIVAQLEARGDDANPTLEGYAATFDQLYQVGQFREKIDPSAFTRTLGTGPDVRLLIDHQGQPLARTKSGTLQLSQDATGLHVRAQLDPSDPDVQRLLPKMRRGDLDQMSFAFRVPSGGDTWSDDWSVRTIREANLAGGDVSVVTYPANEATSVSVRGNGELVEVDPDCLLLNAMEVHVRSEVRVGKAHSAATLGTLQKMHDLVAGMIGPGACDPKDDAPVSPGAGQANSGRPLGLALAVATQLGIPAKPGYHAA